MDIIIKEKNLVFNVPNDVVVYNKKEFFKGFNIDSKNMEPCVAIIGNSKTNDVMWIDEIAQEANSHDFDSLSEYDSEQLAKQRGYKTIESKLLAESEEHFIKYFIFENQNEYMILLYELYNSSIYRAHLQTKNYKVNLSFAVNIMKSMTFIDAKNL